jgi:hypothetical protein
MRSLKVLGIISLCLLGVAVVASAGTNSMGISDLSHVTFGSPIHVGTALLPAGDYEVRHVMQGQDHIMVFKRVNGKDKDGVKVNCKLVALDQKAEKTETIYEVNASNERVLRELIFRGDTAKHVF